jgi:hypothetical protein
MPPDDLRGYSPPVQFLAGPTGEEWRNDAALAERLGRYASHRLRANAMRQYIAALPERDSATTTAVRAMTTCGLALAWRHYYVRGESRLLAARTCKKHLLCPFCATRRAARSMARYLERVELVTTRDPALRLMFVTLTVKNGEDLAERFNHLHSALRILRKRVSRDNAVSEFSKVAGAVWSFEAKRGANSGLWHPHVHGVWLVKEDLDAAELSRQWHAITGDSFVVDVRPVSEDVGAGFAEVFKYALKFSDLPIAENFDAWFTLRNRRLVAASGCLFGVEVPDEGSDDLIADDDRFYDLLFRYVAPEGGASPPRYRFAGWMGEPDNAGGAGAVQPPAKTLPAAS